MKTILISSIILCSLLLHIKCDNICYDGYGCFTTDFPFGNSSARPFSLLPQSPSYLDIRYVLYNKNTHRDGELISVSNFNKFNTSANTKFIAFGFFNNPDKAWIIEMKDALLKTESMNVVVVDWSRGNGLPYTQATANAIIVGASLANLMNAMVRNTGVSLKSMHCIGHSLGAHLCGYAGARVEGLGRISGMVIKILYYLNIITGVH